MRLFEFFHAWCIFVNCVCLDLCVAAALEAVKESVVLPWKASDTSEKEDPTALSHGMATTTAEVPEESNIVVTIINATSHVTSPFGSPTEPAPACVLYKQHFAQVLLQIVPSSNESQGSLKRLRNWNILFGTGGRKWD
jgi:hypothetical protein